MWRQRTGSEPEGHAPASTAAGMLLTTLPPLPEHELSDTVAGMGMHTADSLPGPELVATGLADLAAGHETIEGLLVLQASDRLRRLGDHVPAITIDRPEARMYALIEQDVGPRRAHGRYNVLRRRLVSLIRSAAVTGIRP